MATGRRGSSEEPTQYPRAASREPCPDVVRARRLSCVQGFAHRVEHFSAQPLVALLVSPPISRRGFAAISPGPGTREFARSAAASTAGLILGQTSGGACNSAAAAA